MSLKELQAADLVVGNKSHVRNESGDPLPRGNQGMLTDSFQRLAQHKLLDNNRPRQPDDVLGHPRRGSSFKDLPDEFSHRYHHYTHSRGLSCSGDSAASSSRRGSASTSTLSIRRGSAHTDLESQRAEPAKRKRPDCVSSASFDSRPRLRTLSAAGKSPFSASTSVLLDGYNAGAETESLTFQEALESLSPSSEPFREESKDPVITEISTARRGASGPGSRRNSRSRVADSFKPFGQYGRSWLWPLSKKNKNPEISFAQCVQVTQEITIEIQTDPDYRPPASARVEGQDGSQLPINPNEYPDFRTHHELFGGGPPSPTQTDEEARDKSRSDSKKHSRFPSSISRRSLRCKGQSETEETAAAPATEGGEF